MSGNVTAPKVSKQQALMRREQAVKLRLRGLSYRQIAAALDCSVETAFRYVKSAMDEVREQTLADAETMRQEELERLDSLEHRARDVLEREHVRLYRGEPVRDGEKDLLDDGPALEAISVLLRVMERRAKLLGLDALQKPEQTGESTVRVIHGDDETPGSIDLREIPKEIRDVMRRVLRERLASAGDDE